MEGQTHKISFPGDFIRDFPLSGVTTVRLGGKAKYFRVCEDTEDIKACLSISKEKSVPLYVISGGSNVIFPDEGFEGIVIKIASKGTEFEEAGNGLTRIRCSAGEDWDRFVKMCVDKGLAGIECLSGIPGSAGSTPIQNVGAYGQEVKDTIESVKAIDRETMEEVSFSNEECGFGYRQSRFKSEDKDRYIITEVTFLLRNDGEPELKYPELKKQIEESTDLDSLPPGSGKLNAVRDSVIGIRRRKSMVIDGNDENSVSCGSFFMNPVLEGEDFEKFKAACENEGLIFPLYDSQGGVKIPAAWLIENAGFRKGYRKGGAGISGNHTLALVNYSGTAKELLALAEEIKEGVKKKFGITLYNEPVIIK